MGVAEIFLVLSVLANWYLYGETQELDTQLEIASAAGEQCQAHLKDSRQRELEAEERREKSDSNLRGILARSELNTREFDQMDSRDCGGAPLPSGNRRVAEHLQRTDALNDQWLRGSSSPDDSETNP